MLVKAIAPAECLFPTCRDWVALVVMSFHLEGSVYFSLLSHVLGQMLYKVQEHIIMH